MKTSTRLMTAAGKPLRRFVCIGSLLRYYSHFRNPIQKSGPIRWTRPFSMLCFISRRFNVMDDGLQKKLPVDRLRQVIVAANFKRTVSIFTHRSRGQCHDRLLETAPTQLRGRLSLMDFSEEFKISGRNLVHANDEILKLFKNPRLPSIFIGDRHGSIADYHIDVSAKDISAVENYLRLMTAI